MCFWTISSCSPRLSRLAHLGPSGFSCILRYTFWFFNFFLAFSHFFVVSHLKYLNSTFAQVWKLCFEFPERISIAIFCCIFPDVIYISLSVHLRYCGGQFTDFLEEIKSLITCMSTLPMLDVVVDCRNSIMGWLFWLSELDFCSNSFCIFLKNDIVETLLCFKMTKVECFL